MTDTNNTKSSLSSSGLITGLCFVGIGIGLIGAVAAIGLGSYGISRIKKGVDIERDFNESYMSALLKHADTNKDGFVSIAENESFDRELLRGTQFRMRYGVMPNTLPIYSDGTPVSKDILANLVKNYDYTNSRKIAIPESNVGKK